MLVCNISDHRFHIDDCPQEQIDAAIETEILDGDQVIEGQ